MFNTFIGGGLAALAGGALVAGGLLGLRQRSYHRHLKYDPAQNSTPWFSKSVVETISVHCDGHSFVAPEAASTAASAFLALDLRATITGTLFDPSLEIEAPGFHDVQCLERAVRGIRYLNITRLLAAGISGPIKLCGWRLTWRPASAQLHISRERLQPSDRVIVIAPHPDDAEIAGFGLYSDLGGTVVTISAGEDTNRYSGDDALGLELSRESLAKIRVLESIAVPQIGGILPENAINLCYPDGKLREMRAEATRDFRDHDKGGLDFDGLRRLNHSALVRKESRCSWESLVNDLAHVFEKTSPSVIVTPHPLLDPHSDHVFATLAVCEALRHVQSSEGRFYFYANHNRRSELYPYGPAGSGCAMLPIFASDEVGCDDFYSHSLSPERQSEKLLALEAMHDLRDINPPQPLPILARLRRIRSEIGAIVDGLGRPPTSYLRRAVRPDELFFVAAFSKERELSARILQSLSSKNLKWM